MYFCPKCNFMLDINNKISNNIIQEINSVEEFIELFNNINDLDFNYKFKFKLADLQKNKKFLKLNSENKNNLINNFNKIYNTNNIYFFCNNCNYIEPIENGKVLFTSSNLNNNNKFDLPNDINIISDKTTPRTKDFICPNKKCITNSKKNANKEAIFFRPNPKSYKLVYICVSCSQKWSP